MVNFPLQQFLLIIAAFIITSCSSFPLCGCRNLATSRWVCQVTLLGTKSRRIDREATNRVACTSRKPHHFSRGRSFSALGGSRSSDNSSLGTFNAGDILLCIKFSFTDSSGVDRGCTTKAVVEEFRTYVRSFPYAAFLPVQPMQYLPSERGVTITFLRKKTAEKGMQDGGIQIDVVGTNAGTKEDENDEHDILDNDESSFSADQFFVELTASRIANGQTVSKVFSEKIVALKLLEGIRTWVTNQEALQPLGIQLTSVYHKWMDVVTN